MVEQVVAQNSASKAKMLSVPEVAEKLGFTAWTIRQWAHQGILPGARKMGNQWRFNAQKIDEYIDRAGGRRK